MVVGEQAFELLDSGGLAVVDAEPCKGAGNKENKYGIGLHILILYRISHAQLGVVAAQGEGVPVRHAHPHHSRRDQCQNRYVAHYITYTMYLLPKSIAISRTSMPRIPASL